MLRALTSVFAFAAAPAFADAPKVVTDIAPLHSLTAQVMDGIGMPVLLAQGAQDPHRVQLKPSQVRAIQNADVVYWMGAGLSSWLGSVLDSTEQAAAMDMLGVSGLALLDFASEPKLGDEDQHDHEDDHVGGHDDDNGDDHDGHESHTDEHDHTGADPHAWLSVANAKIWVAEIAGDLSQRDPANASTYKANEAKTLAGLNALEAEIKAELAPHEGAEIITFHDAYGYFAEAYGIDLLGSVRPSDASAPSAAMVTALKTAVEVHDVSCAFSEPGFDAALLESIASQAGLRLGHLDPSGRTLEPGMELYANMMRKMATEIATCLER